LLSPPRASHGETGSRYFNVEGAEKERETGFGILVFEPPTGPDHAGDVKSLSLRLVQSIPQFALGGKVWSFLAEPPDGGVDSLTGLKFDAKSSGGVAKGAFKALHPLGAGPFTKVETGRVDTFELKPDEAGRRHLQDRIKGGERS
jgi:hypothetical protein